jgi:hypothetical protein
VPAHQVQTHLFDQHDRERSQRQPQWIMRCARRSPRDTTRWQELVVVQCAC